MAHLLHTHARDDLSRIAVLLRHQADFFDAGFARGDFHRGSQTRAVVVFQQIAERLRGFATAAATFAAFRTGRSALRWRIGWFACLFFFVFPGEFVALEIKLKGFVVERFFVRRLGEHQSQRVFEPGAVGVADDIHGTRRVDAFGRRNPQARAARDLQKLP